MALIAGMYVTAELYLQVVYFHVIVIFSTLSVDTTCAPITPSDLQ